MTRTIVISNQKGGVGKTTTAVNLASGLALSGKNVLLIDLDPQANASSAFDFKPFGDQGTIYDALHSGRLLQHVIIKTFIEGLDLAPAHQDMSGLELELVNQIGREYKVSDIINSVKHNYEYVIIDTPPTLGLLTVNALTAADSVIIPIQAEYYALEGLSQLMKTVSLIKKRLNPELDVEGVLLTMVDHRNKLSQQVHAEINHYFGHVMYSTTIPRNVRLSEAPSHGKPALLYSPKSKGSLAYFQLVNELLEQDDHHSDLTFKGNDTEAYGEAVATHM